MSAFADECLARYLAHFLATHVATKGELLVRLQAGEEWTWDEHRSHASKSSGQNWQRFENYRAEDWQRVYSLAVALSENPESL